MNYLHEKGENKTTGVSLGIFLFALVSILGFPFSAFADYVSFQNRIPEGSVFGVSYDMIAPAETLIEFIATTTITQLDRIDVPLCKNTSFDIGTMDLEIRSSATSGPVIASSTVSINSGNIYTNANCAVYNPINGTTTTFVLNNKLQTLPGVTWWLRFRRVGASDNPYFSLNDTTLAGGNFKYYPTGSWWTSWSVSMIGRSLGTLPSGGIVVYNASSTSVVCSTFDVGCYFSTGLSWAFTIPSSAFDPFIQLKDDLKDHAPWGYFTSAYVAVSGLTSTGSPAFVLATSSPLMTYIFTPVKTGITWLILLAGVFWIYKRTTDIII